MYIFYVYFLFISGIFFKCLCFSLSLSFLGNEGSCGSVPLACSKRLSPCSSRPNASMLAGRQTGQARLWFSVVISWPSHKTPRLPKSRPHPVRENYIFHILIKEKSSFDILLCFILQSHPATTKPHSYWPVISGNGWWLADGSKDGSI